MSSEPVDEASVLALTRAMGLKIPREDLKPLARAAKTYAEAAAKLESLDLDVAELDRTVDPRAGW